MAGPAPGPWPAGAGAAAQVFVADLDRPTPDPADRHHLARVLRLRPGEPVVAADGDGRWRPCRFGAGGALEPDGAVVTCTRPGPPLTVAFAPVKGDRPEWVVQKLAELGVDRVVVLRAARSVVRWEGERGARALDRLRRVAREAAAQARQPWVPEVAGVCSPAELAGAGPLALAHRGGGPPDLACPAVAVGPEGGWDPAELGLGLPTVGLGPAVLRAETAAVAVGVLLAAARVAASPA